MSERRMISKSLIETKLFYEMSTAAQALYLRLTVSADDDGFVSCPDAYRKILGIRINAINELIKGGFIYMFPSGVAVIRHWHFSNRVRPEMYRSTVFTDEVKSLKLSGGVYYMLEEGEVWEPEKIAPAGAKTYTAPYYKRAAEKSTQSQSFDVSDIMRRALEIKSDD